MGFRSASYGTATASGTASIPKPAGLAVGDLMLLWASARTTSTAVAFTVPSGFDLVGSALAQTAQRSELRSKVATADDVAASTFAVSFTGNALACALVAVEAGTYDKSGTYLGTSTVTIGTLTPAQAGSLLVFFAGSSYSSATPRTFSGWSIATDNPAWTEQVDQGVSDGSYSASVGCATAVRSATTATGDWTASASSNARQTGAGVIVTLSGESPAAAPMTTLRGTW